MPIVEYKELPATKAVESRWLVQSAGQDLFEIGFRRDQLIYGEVYVTLAAREGLRGLSRSVLRKLQRDFEAIGGYTFYCQTELEDPIAARFARFFGFKKIGQSLTRVHFQKEVS